jgi:hypothetical protein
MLTSSHAGQAVQPLANLQAGGTGFAVDENLCHGRSFQAAM